MGPEAVSKLEPAGDWVWKGFCPRMLGRGSPSKPLLVGVSGPRHQGWSQPVLPGQCHPCWVGNGPAVGWQQGSRHPCGGVCHHHGGGQSWAEPVPKPLL